MIPYLDWLRLRGEADGFLKSADVLLQQTVRMGGHHGT